jgi:hypothetical protein
MTNINEKCYICSEIIKNLKILECNHKYCEDCIDIWINNNQYNCPICYDKTLLTRLIAYGECDKILTNNKPITYFTVIYKRK